MRFDWYLIYKYKKEFLVILEKFGDIAVMKK